MKVWIDVDNSPHVPFFLPQIREIERLGHSVTVTSRESFQTQGLLDLAGLSHFKIGRHYGKKMFFKMIGGVIRALQLYAFARGRGFNVAANHGSGPQTLAAYLLKIPCVGMTDYEHQIDNLFNILSKMLVPEFIPNDVLQRKKVQVEKIVKYPGLKEDVYVCDFHPNLTILDELNIDHNKIVVTIRPPAEEAHYHNKKSEHLLSEVINFVCEIQNTAVVVFPRTDKQRRNILELAGKYTDKIIIPKKVINGLDMIWHSDLVISGGGTMTREAAALFVPAYSIFSGQIGAVDRYLESSGRLQLISSSDQIRKIIIKKRERVWPIPTNSTLVQFVVNEILSAAR